ncbi:MAG: esterase/lipase family protein [Candidatus Sericytochromatia bacterium]
MIHRSARFILTGLVASLLLACQSPTSSARAPQTALRAQSTAQGVTALAPIRTGFEQFEVIKRVNGTTWPSMELLRTPGLPAEPMQERGRQRDPEVLSCFGTALPPSTDVCLHDAGAPAQLRSQVPVLLIHGANVNATTNWATPPYTDRKSGLMQHLRSQGYRVFAVTFSNKHGDNFVWANHVHNAIARIRTLTGAQQVDAIGHSKGGFTLRMYTSDILGPGMTQPYRKSIRKALFIAAPHRGLDYTFRNSAVHWGILPEGDDPVKYAPVAWTKALILGQWLDTSRSSFTSEFFRGQAQMLARWDKEYPILPTNPDWYTTYNGGQGFVSVSPGIDAVIKAGGNIVDQLRRNGVDPAIQVGLLAGNRPNMAGILNELTGPSDGLAFVKSTAAAEDVTRKGARLLDQSILPLHHMGLVSEPAALDWVSQQLQK